MEEKENIDSSSSEDEPSGGGCPIMNSNPKKLNPPLFIPKAS